MTHELRSALSGPGAAGFPKQYWDDNYDKPETMDGIVNARRRAEALKAVFDAEYVDVSSLIDYGFGLGHLLRELTDLFLPYTVVGIEPSPHAFNLVANGRVTTIESVQVHLVQTDLVSWCQLESQPLEPFDLGVCTSVFQYLTDAELRTVIPVLARQVRYLYFTVPTDVEFRYQREELDFEDRYAISRTREEYMALLRGHFTVVSNRVLESNVHFDEETTYFSDLFFRFA